MRFLAILVVAGIALVFVGVRIIDRGKELNAVAKSTEATLDEVTGALREATANVSGPEAGSPEARWATEANAVCSRQAGALRRLGTPKTFDEIAAYLKKALPTVRRHHGELGSLPPPAAVADQASRAGRALLRQEALLAEVRAAARRGDTQATLAGIEKLRALARRANPNLVRLGLTACALPSPGLPL